MSAFAIIYVAIDACKSEKLRVTLVRNFEKYLLVLNIAALHGKACIVALLKIPMHINHVTAPLEKHCVF